ncbi:toxin-antitoxin system TumE family protein [Geobacter anodireducens]
MGAVFVFRDKKVKDGLMIEMVVWELDAPLSGSSHSFKYRLFCGNLEAGTSLVRYDNERGKGDHRHVADEEQSYWFTSLEVLFADFEKDVREALKK